MHTPGVLSDPDELVPGGFLLSRADSLLGRMVAALLLDTRPGAAVRPDPRSNVDDWGGVRVTYAATERWMCVFADAHPARSIGGALSHGATAVVTINSEHRDFVRAVDAVTLGDSGFVPLDVMRWVVQADSTQEDGARPSLVRLTAREREVLRLVAAGCSNNEIADALTISLNTVRTHLHSLSTKLNASSRTRMLANARALGIDEANGGRSRQATA